MSKRPLISVVTVCFNAGALIERTLLSVAAQQCVQMEYIVLDGNSKDDTCKIIDRHRDSISQFSSEPDSGIYDAMNRGVSLATGEWIIFMNAGDTFHDTNVLNSLIEGGYLDQSLHDFLYSDVCLVDSDESKTISKCDHTRVIINHQCSIYRRSLHQRFGSYLVAPQVTISDYLFFCLIPSTLFLKVEPIIANYETAGVSQGQRAIEQKFTIDFLLGRMGRTNFIMRLFFFKYYLRARKILRNH